MSNMEIWDQVCRTDLKWTKDGQNNLTSINGMYCTMRATEVFGPCGIGWGYDILEERIDDGVPHKHENGDYVSKVHTIKIKLWYKLGEERGEISHFGHTPYVMRSKYGAYLDDEAPKKSLTDAIKKCLSMVGIGADIHLGQFDDVSYKSELVLQAKQEKENRQKEKEDAIKEDIKKIMNDAGLIYVSAKNQAVLTKIHKDTVRDMRQLYERAGHSPDKSIESLTSMFKQASEKLTKKGNENDK